MRQFVVFCFIYVTVPLKIVYNALLKNYICYDSRGLRKALRKSIINIKFDRETFLQ